MCEACVMYASTRVCVSSTEPEGVREGLYMLCHNISQWWGASTLPVKASSQRAVLVLQDDRLYWCVHVYTVTCPQGSAIIEIQSHLTGAA